MATGAQVLSYLLPEGGWAITGDEYEGITFIEAKPISKEEFEQGFAEYDDWKAAQIAAKEAKKQQALAKLEALGLDVDDLKVLGLG